MLVEAGNIPLTGLSIAPAGAGKKRTAERDAAPHWPFSVGCKIRRTFNKKGFLRV
jgi:hypothetical protein